MSIYEKWFSAKFYFFNQLSIYHKLFYGFLCHFVCMHQMLVCLHVTAPLAGLIEAYFLLQSEASGYMAETCVKAVRNGGVLLSTLELCSQNRYVYKYTHIFK